MGECPQNLFSYLIKPDKFNLTTTQLEIFSWMNIDDDVMQQAEFKSTELWTGKSFELW